MFLMQPVETIGHFPELIEQRMRVVALPFGSLAPTVGIQAGTRNIVPEQFNLSRVIGALPVQLFAQRLYVRF
jgi:hypothetical protein